MFFDDDDLHFGLRCWEAHMERVVANDMIVRQQRAAARSCQYFETLWWKAHSN